MTINTIVTILVIAVAVVGLIVFAYIYLRDRSLEEIRADVYQLFLQAEHTYLEPGSGNKKMKWVISKTRSLLPSWAQLIVTDDLLYKVVEGWFKAVKDLLDDGKINKSTEGK